MGILSAKTTKEVCGQKLVNVAWSYSGASCVFLSLWGCCATMTNRKSLCSTCGLRPLLYSRSSCSLSSCGPCSSSSSSSLCDVHTPHTNRASVSTRACLCHCSLLSLTLICSKQLALAVPSPLLTWLEDCVI